MKFIDSPELAPILQHPKFLALTSDPAVQAAATQRNVLAIMMNPKVFALATDPEILAVAQKIDLDKALDRALKRAEPVPSQVPAETFE